MSQIPVAGLFILPPGDSEMTVGESAARAARGIAARVYLTRWQAPLFGGPWVSNFAYSATRDADPRASGIDPRTLIG
jgi:hypothetical protein